MTRRILRTFMLLTALLSLAVFFGHITMDDTTLKLFWPDHQTRAEQIPMVQHQPVPLQTNFEGTVDEIIALVNSARAKEGRPPVKKNEQLMESALAKAKDMRDRRYMEHDTPDGKSFSIFVEQAGYTYKSVGENLAKGYFSASALHDAWMESEGHRKNIMADNYEEIGVAVLETEEHGQKNYLAVQHFGTQLRPEDLRVIHTCKLSAKQECETSGDRLKEIAAVVARQRGIIKAANKDTADPDDLKKAKDNLKRMEKVQSDFETYQKECQQFIATCDQWE